DQERDQARRRERKQYGEDDTGEAPGEEEAVVEPLAGADDKTAASVSAAASAVKPSIKSAAGALLDEKIVVHRRASGPANQDALDRVKSATMAIHSRLNKSGQLRSGIP